MAISLQTSALAKRYKVYNTNWTFVTNHFYKTLKYLCLKQSCQLLLMHEFPALRSNFEVIMLIYECYISTSKTHYKNACVN